MRVAIIAESFLPQINGVANTVCRIVEHLRDQGHHAIIIAPGDGPDRYADTPVVRVPAVKLPGNGDSLVGVCTTRRIMAVLETFAPDVVHLASPAWLGRSGMAAAERLSLPTVAVFQTDLAGFARRYRLWRAVGDEPIWTWLRRIHDRADRTLAPSSSTMDQLSEHRFPRLAFWGRGVDLIRFHPAHRDEGFRRDLAPGGETIVGYVGRLAPEKNVGLLASLRDIPGISLVVVGGGPSERQLRAQLPDATFLGPQTGEALSRSFASLDVFVHTGASETFGQTVQEALASGTPVIAPRAGGPIDLVDHGRTGYLLDPTDPAAWRDAVRQLAETPETRRTMSIAARASVHGHSWRVVCADLIRHYEAVAARRSPPRRAIGALAEMPSKSGPAQAKASLRDSIHRPRHASSPLR